MIQTNVSSGIRTFYCLCWQDRSTGEYYSEIPEGKTEYDETTNPNGECKMCFDGMVRNDQTGELYSAAKEIDGNGATYTEVLPVYDPSIPPVWARPAASATGYAAGAKVRYKGKIYASDIEDNHYEPGAYSYGWSEVWPWVSELPTELTGEE